MTNAPPIPCVVCFGVPERQVDELIEALADTPAQPRRWFVFGQDAHLLGALDKQWRATVNLVIVRMPGAGADLHDAVSLILENEGMPLSQCIWLQGIRASGPSPAGALAAFVVPEQGVEDLVTTLSKTGWPAR